MIYIACNNEKKFTIKITVPFVVSEHSTSHQFLQSNFTHTKTHTCMCIVSSRNCFQFSQMK